MGRDRDWTVHLVRRQRQKVLHRPECQLGCPPLRHLSFFQLRVETPSREWGATPVHTLDVLSFLPRRQSELSESLSK